MNRNVILTILIIMIISIFCIFYSFAVKNESAELKGFYLGQKPPGMTPEVFAPGIVSTEESEGCIGFGLDGNLCVFQRFRNNRSQTYEMIRKDNQWSQPKLVPFSDSHQVGDFTLSPDGKTLYFKSNIFLEDVGADGEGGNIWVSERTASGWVIPKALGLAVNTRWHESFPSVSEDGTLYFFGRRPGGLGKSDLYVSKKIEGEYAESLNLGKGLNTSEDEWDPYIAPDQSYLIFCSTKSGGSGKDDLYVSFRQKGDSWSKPVNMGEPVNSPASENRPWVSQDGKYFFFASTRPGLGKRDIYWMKAGIIEELQPDRIK